MSDLNELKDKIKKLLDKAESAKQIGNLEEANAFAGKVNELLLKYNLSKKEIIEHQEELEVSGVDSDMEVKKAHGEWMAQLLNVLCEYNYCKPIFTSRKIDKEYKITIIGSYENVEVVSYLYDVLKGQFQRLAKKAFSDRIKEWQKANTYSNISTLLNARIKMEDIKELKDGSCTIKKPWKYVKSFPNRGKFFKSFYLGANVGINQKLKEDKARMEKSEIANQVNALVKINDAAIVKYMELHYPDIKTSSSSTRKVDPFAYMNGKAAGQGASMAKGLSNGDTVATKMLK